MPEKEFFKDKRDGMPLEDALETYTEELGEDFIRGAYKKEIEKSAQASSLIREVQNLGEKIDNLPHEFPKFPEIHIPEVEFPQFPKEIKISNLPEYPRFPKIPSYPTEIEVKKPKWLPKPEKVDLSNVEKLLFGVKTAFSTLFEQISAFLKKNILRIRIEEQKEPLETYILDRGGHIIEDFAPKVSVSGGGGGGGGLNKTDMREVLGELATALEAITVEVAPLIELKVFTTLVDDYIVTNKTYIGKAPAGSSEVDAVWQIKCLDETGNFAKIQWADGVSTFSKVWNDRTTYSYS